MRVASLAWLSRCSRRESLAERVLRTPPLPGSPWDVLPNDIGQLARDDFPNLWRTRQEKFGRGGRGAAPILRSQFVANESAAARARGKAAREREKTKEATARAEKMSERLAKSQWALFNSQEETAAANERIAGLVDQLRRARQQSAQNEQLEREAELRRRSDEARRREAEARRREADENRSAAERERDRLRADLEELKAKEDARDADAARTRANAHVLLGEDDDDDVATLGDRVQAFRSAIATMRKALGEKDALSIWDKIYRKVEVGRDTLVENVMTMFGPATATKEWTADQMFMRPIRVEFDRCGAVQRSGKSSEKGKEAGIDDGGLRNEMYEKFFEQLLLLRTDLFEASESAICARALPTKDATWTALPDAARIEKDFETVGRVMCRAVVDGRPIPNALASTIVLRFFQGVEPAALDASGAMVRGPLSKAALLEELLLMDEANASSIGKWILNSEQSLTDFFSTVGDALCYNSTEDRSAASDAQILAMPWNDEPAFRILVFERLVQRRLIEPRRKALEAMRRGFATVEMVPQLTRTLFPSSKELVHFICGDDKLDADKLWSLFTFDEEAYSQTFIDYDHPSGEFGLYTEDDPTMRHLKTVLSEFCDAERLKFFKFVSGLAAIPATRPGEAKPFQLLVDGKDLETNRLPTTSTCYYQLHCPPYPTKDVLKDKLRLAIEAEGFDQK